MAVSREELNRRAHALASQAQLLAVSRGKLSSNGDPGAVSELARDCQQLRREIEELEHECAQLPGVPQAEQEAREGSVLEVVLQEMRLKAEKTVLENEQAKLLSTRGAVIQSEAYQQVRESVAQLNHILAVVRKERKAAQENLKREQELLQETQQLEQSLQRELSRAGEETGGGANNVEADLRERVALAQESIRTLRENLVWFTSDELPQPSDPVTDTRGKRRRGQTTLDTMLQRGSSEGDEGETQFPSLAEVTQELISKALSSPHSPYLPLSSIWPPHSNLLLRIPNLTDYPIILCHQNF